MEAGLVGVHVIIQRLGTIHYCTTDISSCTSPVLWFSTTTLQPLQFNHTVQELFPKCSIRTSTYIYNITVMLVSRFCCANHTQKRNEKTEIQSGATSLSGCLQLLSCQVVAKTKRLIAKCEQSQKSWKHQKGFWIWLFERSWFFLSPINTTNKQTSK